MVKAELAVLLLSVTCAGHAAQLRAWIDTQTSRLGEPVTLHIEARGRNASLEEVTLADLAADFEVFSITRSGGEQGVQLEATLYPLRSGVLQIPAFAAAGAKSRPLSLTVSEDPDLTLDARFVPDSIFERQGSTLTLTLRDKADRPWLPPTRLQAPGLLLRPLGERQFQDGSGPERVNVRELRWEALGLRAGHHALRLPMLDAYQLGRRLRVPLPVAPLEVRALPAYLPVAVPVGRPAVSVAPLPATGQVGQAVLWGWRIAAPGFTADAARALLHLPVGERAGLRFYPADIREEKSEQGTTLLRVEIPVLLTRAGRARLPALSLPYFDPATQRVEALPLPAAGIEVTDPFWRRLAGLAGFVVLLGATGFGLYWGRTSWERRQARRAALQRVAQAETPAALVHAVCAFGRPPWPPTLRQWLARQPSRADLDALVEALERLQFGRVEGADLAAIRQRWLAALNRLPLT